MPESQLEAPLAPARQKDLFQEVADRLREAILRGRFKPGERLRETELATMLEVSRGPIREALAQLEHEGLVITQRNHGATVARLSREDAEEVKSLRLALERLAVQLIVRSAGEEVLVALDQMVQNLKSADTHRITVREIAEFEIQFHDLLYRSTGHGRLYQAWSSLRSQVHTLLLSRNVDDPGIRDVVIHRHGLVMDALRSRDENVALAVIEAHVFGLEQPPYQTQEAAAGTMRAGSPGGTAAERVRPEVAG
jgi:DNA-binding GntR family transcriptional regulator